METKTNYSILMAVYRGDNPYFFDEALDSLLNQTKQTNDLVLVCDGPLTKDLNLIIEKYKNIFKQNINVIRIPDNLGLGNALREGLNYCKNEIVLRADSDDISLPIRAERQIDGFVNDNVDIASNDLVLFNSSITNVIGHRRLPKSEKEIYRFSKKRCPFNHPSIIYKKSKVLSCGGYEELKFQEDYLLWYKMLKNGCKCINYNEELVYMRVNPDTLKRRRNKTAYNNLNFLYKKMFKEKYISFLRLIINLFINFLRQHLPLFVSSFITKLHWR